MASLPSPSQWSRFGLIVLGAGFILVLGMLWLVQHLPASRKPEKPPVASIKTQAVPESKGAAGTPALTDPVVAAAAVAAQKAADTKDAIAELEHAIGDALAALRDPSNPNKPAALDALRGLIQRSASAVSIAAIRHFLSGKEDAATGLGFKVGQNGVLEQAPTLRTFLMDQLGTISTQAGTADAAEVGREILETKTSPDEWAVAMRNVAWADPVNSKNYLAGKARELIDYPPWQQAHSGGYLEAFDIASYSGDASLFSDLAPLANANSILQHAALVAMDRLSALAPDQVSNYLNAHPDLLSDRPLIRADYMGKMDLSDPAQQTQALDYLQRMDVSVEEKSKFLSRLAMPAGFVSNNLLTPPEAQSTNIFARRAVVNQTASNWLQSGQFPALQAPLQQLVTFTQPGT